MYHQKTKHRNTDIRYRTDKVHNTQLRKAKQKKKRKKRKKRNQSQNAASIFPKEEFIQKVF